MEERFRSAGLRVTGDWRPEKLGAKIRDWRLAKVPYAAVVGERDAAAGGVSLRDRVDDSQEQIPVEQTIARLLDEVARREVRQVTSGSAGLGEGRRGDEY